jgi:hypothetical protein
MDMQLLIKKIGNGQAAHLVDRQGLQLCTTNIKQSDWHIVDVLPEKIIICYHCRRIQAQTQCVPLDFTSGQANLYPRPSGRDDSHSGDIS